jgi:hypothetical protein
MILVRVCIKGKTWARDSHGLYDYEDRENLKQYNFSIACEMSIIRHGDELIPKRITLETKSDSENQ